ncbi:calcineurin b-like protein [Stylonychia lemnae]|uniref:Calcineurin b-like protein n=1 Tax=Stylonychia lemnae TaxID=5949 RepID=A0A078AW65_STYLE|nr:calcineurin b-like protein [Stylonychia lemnae]|eukprot:CDW85472.1 calcineurin b-like protein [Stylonychia lemnae]
MGVSNTKIKCLKSNELLEFSKVSTFTQEEINDLYLYFNQLSKSQKDDGVIDYDEFCQAIGLKHGIYSQNLFKLFDTNDDKVINFREFIIAFATFLNETIDKQIKLSFRIYDPKDKGYVKKDTLVDILRDAIRGLGTCDLPEEVIQEIVDDTFRDLKKYQSHKPQDNAVQNTQATAQVGHLKQENDSDKNVPQGDIITFEMYEKMVYDNNDILKWLAVDLQRISQGAKLIISDKAVIKNIN